MYSISYSFLLNKFNLFSEIQFLGMYLIPTSFNYFYMKNNIILIHFSVEIIFLW